MQQSQIESMIRKVFPTSGNMTRYELEGATDVWVDNRAIGYRATAVGGKEASFEPLAEAIVLADIEMDLAAALQDTEVLTRVFDTVFPKKETLKITGSTGLLSMAMIIRAFEQALSGEAVKRRTLAHIMAELTAHAIRHLNIVLPFDGIMQLSAHDAVFPNYSVIKEAASIKRVTDVLEAMKLDPELGRVKTLSAAALLSAMGPMFARSGRLLLQTIEQDMYLQDTFLLLKWFVTQDSRLPRTLINDANLRALSTNITIVLAACSVDDREVVLPEYFLRDAVSETALRLRELKRFSVKHLTEVKQWYLHNCIYDNPGQRVVGLLFARNVVLENRPQVTIFTQIGSAQTPFWTQASFAAAENRVEPLLTHLFNTELQTTSLAALVTGVATYATPLSDETAVILANGATDIELMHYAATISRRIVLTEGEGGYSLGFVNEDTELNYSSSSAILGTLVLSSDPAEGVIHSGIREGAGESALPARVQGIPDSNRGQMLITNPDSFTVNLARPFLVKLDVDGTEVSYETSLAKLLVLPEQLRLSLTKTLTTSSVVRAHFELILGLADRVDITKKTGEIARLRAATALSNFLLAVGASPAGRGLLRSVMLKLVAGVDASSQDALRGRLRNAMTAYNLAITVGGALLSSLDLLDDEQVERALSLIKAQGLDTYMIGSVPHMADLI